VRRRGLAGVAVREASFFMGCLLLKCLGDFVRQL
jgi:hypothetical protein